MPVRDRVARDALGIDEEKMLRTHVSEQSNGYRSQGSYLQDPRVGLRP